MTRCHRCLNDIPEDAQGKCYVMIRKQRFEVCEKCACFYVGIPYQPIFSKSNFPQ